MQLGESITMRENTEAITETSGPLLPALIPLGVGLLVIHTLLALVLSGTVAALQVGLAAGVALANLWAIRRGIQLATASEARVGGAALALAAVLKFTILGLGLWLALRAGATALFLIWGYSTLPIVVALAPILSPFFETQKKRL